MAEDPNQDSFNSGNNEGDSQNRGGDRRGGRGGKGRRERKVRKRTQPVEWIPKTRVGLAVQQGIISSPEDLFQHNYRVQEKEIFDILIPNLKETVVDITMVQKQSDSGQQGRFKAIVCVGNEDGYIGIAASKTKEVGPGIRKAIASAKMNIIPVKRGCGSWECNCQGNHSIPFEIDGKSGSVKVLIKPAAKGTGLVASNAAKIPLTLAGIKDCYVYVRGNSRNSENTAKAIVDALKNAYKIMAQTEWSK
jgi:small subunit ribosomal protein S5